MRILDLFCGAGGASMGYHQAFPAAQIVGVDINPQPDYPFDFIQDDAYKPLLILESFDLIHASPPCQAFSTQTPTEARGNYPDDVQPVRDLLGNLPHIIENVRGAGLTGELMLCGSMFSLQVQRHRYFEHNLPLIMAPSCNHHEWNLGYPVDVTGKPCGWNAKGSRHLRQWKDINQGQNAMGIHWTGKARSIAEAIPPAYTRYIGEQYGQTL